MLQSEPKRGRPHNADGAREAILDAAERVFAEHGFDGARVDTIAAESGYNKSLIFQYFGDKLKLYESVIRRADEQMRTFQNQMLAGLFEAETINNVDRLKPVLGSFVTAYFDYLAAHPHFVRILNWEMAEGWQTYVQLASEREQADMAALSSPLQQILDSGWLRSQLNPMGQMMLMLFTSHLYLGLLPLFRVYIPDFDAQSEAGLASARTFLVNFITHGLIADPGEGRA